MGGGALQVGLGCGGDGGVGPTLVAYLCEAGVRAEGAVEVTVVEAAAGMARAPWLAEAAAGATAAASTAAVATVVATAVRGSGLGLDQPARGGEEWHTWGLKLCALHVFTMPWPKKGRT